MWKAGEMVMSYKSPIDLVMSDIHLRLENEICNAVHSVDIHVDKDELLKALQYDREQYRKGYSDRDSEIVRCRDCKYWNIKSDCEYKVCKRHSNNITIINFATQGCWFCADGVRRDET